MKKDMNYVVIPSMTGTDRDASITFINAVFQENENVKRYPDPDFGAWLFEEVYNRKKILAERRGVFRKKISCASCGTELNPELKTPMKIEYELKFKDFNPFVLQITVPSVVCPQCDKISGVDLDGSLNDQLNEAMIAAFKSENIKP
ncbi:MAG: hypothetical protein QY329_12690 [Anaerolineales bacterium]|nr:MAG: hypothetical protein QY329_12690 [Anaerolineales bacterium]